jgi:tetratricopeptide (TPR) repeat protein
VANALSSIGKVYTNQGKGLEAIEYYERAKKKHKETEDISGVVPATNGIGKNYELMGETDRLQQEANQEEISKKKHKNLIQYSLVALVVLLLAASIAATTKFSFKPKVASALIFILFILIFEFLLVVLDPWVESITDGEVGYKIVLNSVMALLIFGIHQISEKRLKKALIKPVNDN